MGSGGSVASKDSEAKPSPKAAAAGTSTTNPSPSPSKSAKDKTKPEATAANKPVHPSTTVTLVPEQEQEEGTAASSSTDATAAGGPAASTTSDAEKAREIYSSLPHLQRYFDRLGSLVEKYNSYSRKATPYGSSFIEKVRNAIQERRNEPKEEDALASYFALLGGVKITVDDYLELLEDLGCSHTPIHLDEDKNPAFASIRKEALPGETSKTGDASKDSKPTEKEKQGETDAESSNTPPEGTSGKGKETEVQTSESKSSKPDASVQAADDKSTDLAINQPDSSDKDNSTAPVAAADADESISSVILSDIRQTVATALSTTTETGPSDNPAKPSAKPDTEVSTASNAPAGNSAEDENDDTAQSQTSANPQNSALPSSQQQDETVSRKPKGNPSQDMSAFESDFGSNFGASVQDSYLAKARLIRITMGVWLNYCLASKVFAQRFENTGIFVNLLDDVRHLQKVSFESPDNVNAFYRSAGVMFNCAKVNDIRQTFRKIKAVKVFTPFLACENKAVKLLTLLLMSFTTEDETAGKKKFLLCDDTLSDFLLESINAALNDSKHYYACYSYKWQLDALLQGLKNLAMNDRNKHLFMKKGVIERMKPILEKGRVEEQKEAASVVLQLAFVVENQRKIKSDETLIELLKKLQQSAEISGTVEKIFWLLRKKRKTGVSKQGPDRHVMLSYQWQFQKEVKKICEQLQKNGFSVWIDIQDMGGSTLEAMGRAVENAAAILVCMSQSYQDSPNCRMEAEYASQLKKPIVPLIMERDFAPRGWLGILKGQKLHFDFSGKYPFDKKLEDLIRELGARGKHKAQIHGTSSAALDDEDDDEEDEDDVVDWREEDVDSWLHQYDLEENETLQKLCGADIIFLQKMKSEAPEFFYNFMANHLDLKSIRDMTSFCKAIDNLPELHH